MKKENKFLLHVKTDCPVKKKKVPLRMKLILLLILSYVSVTVASNLHAQTNKLTIEVKNKSLVTTLEQIEKQTGCQFFYNSVLVDVNNKISLKVKQRELVEVLDELFTSSNISYKIFGKDIILSKKQHQASSLEPVQQNSILLEGTVILASDNMPAPGVAVVIPGTSIGTTTDFEGRYSLTVPESTEGVSFSYLGYQTKLLKVKDKFLFKLVVLEESSELLEEVIVVGFGTQKKESMVGAIQAVKPSELKITSSNLTTAFAGKIAGVIATQSSGEPGADGANFWIRGISTFGTNSSPLIILDGVEIVSEILNSIAPETIESFSVLKDATATALYGSRGANGVMIITTKTGSGQDKMNINLRVQTGISTPTKVQDIADGVSYMRNYNEAAGYNYFSEDKIDGTIQQRDRYIYPNNDWYKLMFKKFTLNQNANINVSGGNKKIDYFLNAAIHNENGILKDFSTLGYNTNIGLQKYSFQSNVSTKITSTTKIGVKMNTILQYSHRPNESVGNLFYYAMRANPVAFPISFPRQEGDDFIRFGNAPSWDGGANDINPVALMSRGYGDRYLSYLTTVFNADQDLKFITPGLKAKFQASFYNKTYSSTYRFSNPFYFWLNENDPFTVDEYGNEIYNTVSIGEAGSKYLATSTGRDGHREYSIQGSLEYSKKINNRHDINSLIVYHQKEREYNTPAADEYEVLSYREQGIAGRLTYGFDNKYLFEANFGYNGSENFLSKKRWGFFPSVAVGWYISNEAFFESIKNKITLLKVRTSHGKSGNDALGRRFPYRTTILTNQNLDFYYGYNIVRGKGATIKEMGNEDATWETSTKTNLGIEVGLFNDLTIIMDFFRDKRKDIFMQRRSIPTSAGYSGALPYANLGVVKNQGFDSSLEYNKAINKDLIVTFRGTFTYAHNEILANDEPALLNPYTSRVGRPINSIYGLVSNGLFATLDEVQSSPIQDFDKNKIAPGDIKYVDLNNDDIVDGNDITSIGNPTIPEIMYGFGPSIRYKNWDLSFFFQGVAKVSLLMSDIHPFVSSSYSGFGITKWISEGHWSETNQNPNAVYPRLSTTWNMNNTQKSSFWVHNASYLRLKSAEIGWTFKRARLYLTGSNLFYLSGFKFWDPELGSGNGLSYPLQTTGVMGCQFNF